MKNFFLVFQKITTQHGTAITIRQAGAELCQAQGKLKLVWLLIIYLLYLIDLLVLNLASELNFGTFVPLDGLVWYVLFSYTWFCRFGLGDMACFALN